MLFHSVPLRRPSIKRSLRLGTLAGAAYLVEMALDMRLTRNRYDDLVLWGGFFSSDPVRQRIIGAVGHFALSTGLAAGYQATQPLLPAGPPWARGLLFTMVEHLLSFPTVALGDSIHPSVKRGDLPSLMTWQYFGVETARHVAYGLVLGIVADE
ncbi:MAG: hypothetical protein NVS2B16_19790 [Chloroflexota bacterium]